MKKAGLIILTAVIIFVLFLVPACSKKSSPTTDTYAVSFYVNMYAVVAGGLSTENAVYPTGVTVTGNITINGTSQQINTWAADGIYTFSQEGATQMNSGQTAILQENLTATAPAGITISTQENTEIYATNNQTGVRFYWFNPATGGTYNINACNANSCGSADTLTSGTLQ